MSITTSNPFAVLDLTPPVRPRKPRKPRKPRAPPNTAAASPAVPDASFAAAGNVPRDPAARRPPATAHAQPRAYQHPPPPPPPPPPLPSSHPVVQPARAPRSLPACLAD